MKKLALSLALLLLLALFFACTPAPSEEEKSTVSEPSSHIFVPETEQKATLTARFFSEGEQAPEQALKIVDAASDPAFLTDVLLQATGDLHEVRFFRLKLGEEGLFEEEQNIQTLEQVSSGQELVFSFSMPGDLPSHGISFRDGAETLHIFFLSTSGKDGSLVFLETKDLASIPA